MIKEVMESIVIPTARRRCRCRFKIGPCCKWFHSRSTFHANMLQQLTACDGDISWCEENFHAVLLLGLFATFIRNQHSNAFKYISSNSSSWTQLLKGKTLTIQMVEVHLLNVNILSQQSVEELMTHGDISNSMGLFVDLGLDMKGHCRKSLETSNHTD